MTGHEHILKMRRAGMAPACVWVMDDDTPYTVKVAADWHEQPNAFAEKLFAHVRLIETDIPEALDLRFLVGLAVFFQCDRGVDRAKRVYRVLEAARPSFLIACENNEIWTTAGEEIG